jgi:hypothetical protein
VSQSEGAYRLSTEFALCWSFNALSFSKATLSRICNGFVSHDEKEAKGNSLGHLFLTDRRELLQHRSVLSYVGVTGFRFASNVEYS